MASGNVLKKLRDWVETIEVSSLVTSSANAADAPPDAVALPDQTLREIKADQVALLYHMDRGSGVKPVIAFLITTWIIAGFDSAMPWAALALYCAAWTWYHSVQLEFLRTDNRREHPEYWVRRFTLASLGTGLAWGLGSTAWFDPADIGNQAIVALVILGVGASSVISRALHRPATLAFIVPASVPLATSLVFTGTTFGFLMTGFGFLFVTGLNQWSKRLRESQVDTIALRYQNEALVDSLSHQRRAAEAGREAAEAGSRTKSEFLATMSHEVRTPLNGILGMARVLQNSDLNTDQKEQLSVILESGEMLNTVLNDILDLSKLEAGQLDVEHETIRVQSAAESVVQLLLPGARQQGINVEIVTDTQHEFLALGDVHRVRQVLLNLVGNAIKFTHEGEVTVTIAEAGSSMLPEGAGQGVGPGRIVIAVSDTGIGIAPGVLPELFQPFRQADQTTTRKYGGSGLGLAICKRLMDLMGGQIGVSSTPGRGSTFWFALPAAETHQQEERKMPDAAVSDANDQTKHRFILLAEDNDLNAKVAQALLAKAGHEVVRTCDGKQTVDWIEKAVAHGDPLPDLVLMDIRMPNMSGIEAADAIRAMPGAPAKLPIVALTADISMSEFQQNGRSVVPEEYVGRFDGVLPKPITPDHLTDAVEEHTRSAIQPRRMQVVDPRFDSEQFSDLISSVGASVVSDLIETFTADVQNISQGLDTAAAAGDTEELRARAHNLTGVAASLGFVALAEAARRLNRAAHTGEMDAITPELSEVTAAITDAEDIVERLKSA